MDYFRHIGSDESYTKVVQPHTLIEEHPIERILAEISGMEDMDELYEILNIF